MAARIVSFLLGLWLMAAPAVLGYGNPAANADRIVGPIVASFAFIAIWQVVRPLRWVCLPLGLWLLAAPWVLGGYAPQAAWNSVAVGVAVVAASLVRGKVDQRFGGGWSSLWRSPGTEP